MERSTFKLPILLAGFMLCSIQYGFAQVDNLQKNSKIREDAEAAYNSDLEKNPNSALPHWRYANTMAEFTFVAYKDAWRYYVKALDIDSVNPDIYFDFSNYLAFKRNELTDAKAVCKKGLLLAPGSQKLEDNLVIFDKLIEEKKMKTEFYSFGRTDKRSIQGNLQYSEIANIDSLNKVVTDARGRNKFEMYLIRFNNDEVMSNYEVYLMLVGYTQTKDYNPYNYNAIDDIYELADNGLIDDAIDKGENLLLTNPLNPSLNRVLMYCCRTKGDKEKAEYYHSRILKVFDAMLFTGKGSCEEPYVTFWVREEYNFLSYIGLAPAGRNSTGMCTGGMADMLQAYSPRTEEKETVHFNIMPIFKKELRK